MYEKVGQTIQRFDLLPSDAHVVVGVSGGADSLCLLDCLIHLNYNVVVAHLDHQLRPESPAEAEYVREVCARYDVPFSLGVQAVGERSKGGGALEESARLARYNFLANVALQYGSTHVAVGHTADDQVETVLMHVLRGTGPEGLRGMLPMTHFSQWVGIEAGEEMDLVRPLIECTRSDTLLHCEHIGLTPVIDPSNEDTTFFRNRIRHELIPILESYNPGIRQIILRLADVMREQVNFNQAQMEAAWPQVMTALGSSAYRINLEAFSALTTFMQRAFIRQAMANVAPELRDISHEATLRSITWFESTQASISLPGGLTLERFGETALLKKASALAPAEAYPQIADGGELKLSCPGELMLEHGWRISARIEERQAASLKTWTKLSNEEVAVFCAERFPAEVTVRTRTAGDRITLPAVGGSTKIADLMINRKIPRQVRAKWPLVLAGELVLWVPGIHRSNEMWIDDATDRVVVLQLHRSDEVDHANPSL